MNLEKIIAVLVLYNSNLEESESFKTLLKAISLNKEKLTLLVYNNSPSYWSYIGDVFLGLEIIYVNDNLNSGVSKAYNTAFEYAVKIKKEYILLLDQDTSLPISFFTSFFESEKKYHKKNIGIYSPFIMNKNKILSPSHFFLFSSKKIKKIEPGVHGLRGKAIINSGLIIATTLFQKVGGYNEKIKLDFSDFYFVRKVLKHQRSIVLFNSRCFHSLSSEDEMSCQSALNRFDYYLEGAKNYDNSFKEVHGLKIWVFLRSVKMSLKYRKIKFITKALNSIIK
jgi:rhamnosyltransferase